MSASESFGCLNVFDLVASSGEVANCTRSPSPFKLVCGMYGGLQVTKRQHKRYSVEPVFGCPWNSRKQQFLGSGEECRAPFY